MTIPAHGYVPAEFLATLAGSSVQAEKNTAAAFAQLRAAHPAAHVTGPAGGYWSHDLSVLIHSSPAEAAKFGISASEFKLLAGVGSSPHELGTRINFAGVTPAVAAQFGFAEFNAYTFTYDRALSWNEAAIEHNLTVGEVKRVAGYLNSRDLGRTTSAAQTGVNVAPGATSSNYYWEVQRAGKIDGAYPTADLLNGIPGPATYAAERHYRDITIPPVTTLPTPPAEPLPPVSTPPVPTAPAAPSTPVTAPTTPPTEPKDPIVTKPTPKPLTAAQLAADEAKLQADSDALAGNLAPLAGLLAANPIARKRSYVGYAVVALVVSFGPDVVTYGVVTGSHVAPFVSIIGLSTSIVLKIGAAFGLVAASNAK